MRKATLTITRTHGGFHPADRALAAEPAVERDSIREIGLLADASAVVLYALHGDLECAERILAEQATVIRFDVAGADPTEVFIHFQPNETVFELLTLLAQHEVILQTPVTCVRDGVRITIVGFEKTIQAAVDDVPGDLSISLEHITDYAPSDDRPLATLTARQRQILETAAAEGYYDLPRRTSHEALAEELDVSESTVCEHLQKAESKLVKSLLTV